MNKEEKKRRLRALREEEKLRFEESLPMSREQFEMLFDYLDEKLGDSPCSRDHTLTVEFLQSIDIEAAPVLTWLCDRGGYCDCEVLANVEGEFA